MKGHNHCNLLGWGEENRRLTSVFLLTEDAEANEAMMVLATQTGESVHWDFTMWDLYTVPSGSFSLDPPSILAQHSGYFLSYMVLGKWDSRMVGYLAVFLGSYVGQRKREQTPVVTDRRASSKGTPATCVSKAPCGLLTGD